MHSLLDRGIPCLVRHLISLGPRSQAFLNHSLKLLCSKLTYAQILQRRLVEAVHYLNLNDERAVRLLLYLVLRWYAKNSFHNIHLEAGEDREYIMLAQPATPVIHPSGNHGSYGKEENPQGQRHNPQLKALIIPLLTEQVKRNKNKQNSQHENLPAHETAEGYRYKILPADRRLFKYYNSYNGYRMTTYK